MGLYKGQNIITGSYMLPKADDNRQVNVFRKRILKKNEAQVYPVFDSGAWDIQRIHCISGRSRQLMHEEIQKIYLSIFLSLYPKISAIASGATPIGSAGRTPDDIYS
jgi:hypothetical protein